MKIKNWLFKTIAIILCVTSLSGCTQDNYDVSEAEKHKNNSEGSGFNLPSQYNREVNGIIFNIDQIEVADDIDLNNLFRCSVEKQKPNQNKMISILASDTKLEKEDNLEMTSIDGGTSNYYYASFSDGSSIYAYDGGIKWTTKFANKIYYSFNNQNLDKYSKNELFDFMEPDDAIESVINKISECGYELNEYDYTYYALEHKIMKQEEVHEEKVGDTLDIHSKWTKLDDNYMFYITQQNQSIPVYFGTEFFMEDTDPTMMPINAMVSSNGIEEINVICLYKFVETNKKIKMIDFDICAGVVANKYGDILYNATYNVKRAKLYWVPKLNEDGSYNAALAWLFEIVEKGEDEERGQYEKVIYTLINAESGEEIAL